MIGAPISDGSLTLYGSFTSSSSYKPMLYLALAGLPFSFRTVNLKIGVQNTPEYLAINRAQEVTLGARSRPSARPCRRSTCGLLQGKGRVVFTATLAGQAYARHGTTIELRFWTSLSVPRRGPERV